MRRHERRPIPCEAVPRYIPRMKHKTTTASRDPEAFEKLQDYVRDIETAMVTTVTPDGALRSRPMATREFTDDGEIWFLTSDDSGKAGDLESEHAVNLSYADAKRHHYVSVTGNGTIVHNRDHAKQLWHPRMKSWFPAGLDDPHLALLRVRIETAEYWDASSSKMVQLIPSSERDGGEHAKIDVRATPASG